MSAARATPRPTALGLVPLPADFFAREPLAVARDLLGCLLVGRPRRSVLVIGRIVEVEAYGGPGVDPSAHSFRGLTPRCRTMFGPPGHAYVFTSHRGRPCLNVTTGDGRGQAVLLRAAEPVCGEALMRARRLAALDEGLTRERLRAGLDTHLLASGPARLGLAFGVQRRDDGTDLCDARGPLRIAVGERVSHAIWLPRVGLNPASASHDWPWRGCDARSPSVSAPRPATMSVPSASATDTRRGRPKST